MSRLSKSAEDIRREERALLEGVLSDERRARESELAKENASRKVLLPPAPPPCAARVSALCRHELHVQRTGGRR